MASVSFISTTRLTSLLGNADPQRQLLVRVIDTATLSIETKSFHRVALINLAEETVVPVGNAKTDVMPKPTVPVATRASRRSGKYELKAFGKTIEAFSLKELLSSGLIEIEKARPGTLEKLSKLKPSTKRIVCKDPNDLFETPGLAEKFGQQLLDGWWYGTNNSAQETDAWLQRACECAGLVWGKDIKTSL